MAEIHFSISTVALVQLSLYDMTGHPVATVLDEHRPAGAQSAPFNAAMLPSGIYICRLHASGESTHSTFIVAH